MAVLLVSPSVLRPSRRRCRWKLSPPVRAPCTHHLRRPEPLRGRPGAFARSVPRRPASAPPERVPQVLEEPPRRRVPVPRRRPDGEGEGGCSRQEQPSARPGPWPAPRHPEEPGRAPSGRGGDGGVRCLRCRPRARQPAAPAAARPRARCRERTCCDARGPLLYFCLDEGARREGGPGWRPRLRGFRGTRASARPAPDPISLLGGGPVYRQPGDLRIRGRRRRQEGVWAARRKEGPRLEADRFRRRLPPPAQKGGGPAEDEGPRTRPSAAAGHVACVTTTWCQSCTGPGARDPPQPPPPLPSRTPPRPALSLSPT